MKFSNEVYAKVVVFYRDIPNVLETHLTTDGRMPYTKDGLKDCGNQKCPRITISIQSMDQFKNKSRLEALTALLETLSSNNQIVSFSVKKSGA